MHQLWKCSFPIATSPNPIVLIIIFVMLYMTDHSAKEALHLILAVPFALTDGYLC
jgi:Cu/Ag efflux pump CusA